MKQQTAQIRILAQALVGALVTIKRGDDEAKLPDGHDNLLTLRPGDEVTIKIASDERWVEREAKNEAAAKAKAAQTDDVVHRDKGTDLDAAARADIAANPQAGPDLSGEAGMTLDQGKAQADAADPADPGAGAGAVTSTTGATTRRSTRGSSQG